MTSILQTKHHPNIKWNNTERDTIFPFSLEMIFGYSDASLSFSCSFAPHVLAVGFIQPSSRGTEQGRVCVVFLLVCLGALEKKGVVGVRPESRSHLRLQVHDLLAHQGNGGAGFLPLHRLQLQGGGHHRLQVLPHPGWWGVGLSYALPRSLTRGLLLVLMGKRTEGKSLFLKMVIKSVMSSFGGPILPHTPFLHVCLSNVLYFIQGSFDISNNKLIHFLFQKLNEKIIFCCYL